MLVILVDGANNIVTGNGKIFEPGPRAYTTSRNHCPPTIEYHFIHGDPTLVMKDKIHEMIKDWYLQYMS